MRKLDEEGGGARSHHTGSKPVTSFRMHAVAVWLRLRSSATLGTFIHSSKTQSQSPLTHRASGGRCPVSKPHEMSTAKCWNFGHIGVAPSSASSCKVSSHRVSSAPNPPRPRVLPDVPHIVIWMATPDGRTPSRQECGQKISKGDVRLGQEYNSRYGGVAWRHLACIGPHGQLIESDHRRKDGGRAKTLRPCPAVPPQYAVPYLRSVCPRRRLGALASRPSFVTL